MAKSENQNANAITKWQPTKGPRDFLVRERPMFEDITKAVGADVRVFELSALLLLKDTPALGDCLRSKEGEASLRNALMRAASTGLSLNPAEGKATIIAYNGKARYQVMKNGMIESAIKTGSVLHLSAELVRENDEFRVSKTISGDEYVHNIAIRDRGAIIGFYASAKLKEGSSHVKYMTVEEMDDHEKRFRSNPNNSSPWVNAYEGMALKTVLKALLRNLHLAPQTSAAVTADDEYEFGDGWNDEPTVNVTPGTSPDDLAAHLAAQKQAPETTTDKPAVGDLDAGRKAGDHI